VFRSILIPTDFSPSAWKAMRTGLDMAQSSGAKVTLLHVFPAATTDKHVSKELFEQLDKVQKNMEKLVGDLTEGDSVQATNLAVSGHVTETLMDFVNRKGFDLVVMGVNSHGTDNSPGKHTLQVIAHSKMPVLIVPNHLDSHD